MPTVEPNLPNTARSVDRALELLVAVGESRSLGLSEAAKKTKLPASTVLRLLRRLESWEFVTRENDGSFVLGSRMMQLSVLAMGDISVARLARSSLDRVVAATGESAYVSAIGPNRSAVYLAQKEGTHAIRHANWVGRQVPLEGTAIGEVLSGKTGTAGYVVRFLTLEPDATAIAAPVVDGLGEIRAALSVVGPSFRLNELESDRVGALLVAEAIAIGNELGQEILTDEDLR